jgi:hypothetical protein
MTKMAALARELKDALEGLPLHTKQLSHMFRNHGTKTRSNNTELRELDRKLAEYGHGLQGMKAKGQKLPPVGTYLPDHYQSAHLDQFKDGVSRFQWAPGYHKYGPFRTDPGGDGNGFVLPSTEVQRILDQARRPDGSYDLGVVEDQLGLDRGTFEGGPITVVDFPNAKPEHLAMPSGNETGANHNWVPFGETSGGVPEAVLHVDSPGAVGHHARVEHGVEISFR